MPRHRLTHLAVLGLLTISLQLSGKSEQSYVQITSVTVEPVTIHRDQPPYEATVTVQILVHGRPTPEATARIDAGTYSADPADDVVRYPKQSKTVRLDKELVVATFTVESTSQTVVGKVVIAATVYRATGVDRIKDPDSDKNWRAELRTAVP